MSWIRDAMILVGLGALGTGLYFYDWRLAAIGVGAAFFLVGISAAIVGALRGES